MLHETDADLASSALNAREEQIARCEADTDLASSALATQEEHVANQEADLVPESKPSRPRPSN